MNAQQEITTDAGTYWVDFDLSARVERSTESLAPDLSINRIESLTSDENLTKDRELVKAIESAILNDNSEEMKALWDEAVKEYEREYC